MKPITILIFENGRVRTARFTIESEFSVTTKDAESELSILAKEESDACMIAAGIAKIAEGNKCVLLFNDNESLGRAVSHRLPTYGVKALFASFECDECQCVVIGGTEFESET